MNDSRLVVAATIADVPRAPWEALTRRDVYGQFGWLQAAETGMNCTGEPRYFMLYRGDQLRVAAAAWLFTRSSAPDFLQKKLFGRAASALHRLLPGARRTLYFGPLIGHGKCVFWERDQSRATVSEAIRQLLREISLHRDYRAALQAFGQLPADEDLLMRVLRDNGHLETRSWPISYLDVAWGSFPEYLESLASRGRKQPGKSRRETTAATKRGVAIAPLHAFATSATAIFDLFETNRRKYGNDPAPFGQRLVDNLAAVHAGRSVLFAARKKGAEDLLGCSLLLTADESASLPLIGVAETRLNRQAFSYFNLAIYEPVRFAIENGIRRVYLGGGMRTLKYRRGFDEMDILFFLRPPGRFMRVTWRILLAVHRQWVAWKSARTSRRTSRAR